MTQAQVEWCDASANRGTGTCATGVYFVRDEVLFAAVKNTIGNMIRLSDLVIFNSGDAQRRIQADRFCTHCSRCGVAAIGNIGTLCRSRFGIAGGKGQKACEHEEGWSRHESSGGNRNPVRFLVSHRIRVGQPRVYPYRRCIAQPDTFTKSTKHDSVAPQIVCVRRGHP